MYKKTGRRRIKLCCVANMEAVKFVLLPQLKFLKDKGYDVSVVCPEGRFVEEIRRNGLVVKTINFQRKITSPFSDVAFFVKLFFYFRKEKFDIVHTHNPKPEFFGQIAAKLAGVPIIINTVHGFPFGETSSFLERRFFILLEKIAALCSDLIFSQSQQGAHVLLAEKISPPDRLRVLGNGIDLARFNPERFSQEDIEKRKKELGLDPSRNVIGIVGRLVREKGYFELFEALTKVLGKFPQTTLLVIGPQEPEKRDAFGPDIIKNYGIEKNVKFLGERMDVDELYPLMDIFALPSWREGFPRSILEASAMERPVVATDISGCREAVEQGKTGILVPVHNPEKLAQAFEALLGNPEKAKQIGKSGREKAAREFDERIVFAKIAKEYKRLIAEKLSEAYKVCYVANMEAVRFFLLTQLKFLERQGYDVSVVCREGRFVKEMRDRGMSIKTINLTRKITPFQDLVTLVQLISYFRKEKFDIVHTHNPKPAFFGQIAATVAGVPIVINTIHGFHFNEYSSVLRRNFFFLLEKITAWFSDRIFSVSQENMKTAIRKHICNPSTIVYIGNGIDPEQFRLERFSRDSIAVKRRELGIESHAKVVGVIARLVKEKGYLDLFEAWKAVARKLPEALLLVIGPSDPEKIDAVDRAVVDSYGIEKNTIFLGERLDVDELYPVMDVFVLPSHREGLPYSLLEASAMEKPTIATDVGGCKEVIENNKTGILIPARNPDQLAKAILYMFEHPNQAAEMARNAREKVKREFDERLVLERIAKEYKDLLEKKLPSTSL